MNCQQFETIVGDLARGLPLEARAREEARAHEGACARCGARLANARALSAGLRGLAASTETATAPPRVEANLLAAFRAHAAQGAGVEAAPPRAPVTRAAERIAPVNERVVTLARPAAQGRRTWAKTLGAAATAAAAAVALFILVPPPESVPPTGAGAPQTAATSSTVFTPRAPETFASVPQTPGGGAPVGTEGAAAGVVKRRPSTPRMPPARSSARATPAAYRGSVGSGPQGARGRASRDEEIATDFFPLTQDARFAVSEGGQMVRVELPRTALQRFGLPMNVERADDRVKADVLLGHDGVARAIRFVR